MIIESMIASLIGVNCDSNGCLMICMILLNRYDDTVKYVTFNTMGFVLYNGISI